MTINLSMPVNHELRPRISVVGVGGAGTNAVNNMITAHLEGVEFLACNTDAQSLAQSLTERRIQLGTSITQGLGAGARPEIGRAAAEEAVEELLDQLQGSHMVFITAGMGGGTGTGAAPVIARAVREQGILTVGVVTKPFHFEGAHRMRVAEGGLAELQQYVDTLIVIPNQNLFRIANERTTFAEAFKLADNVLHMGVRGVTDLMVMPGLINLDFADIRTVMSEMGKAMMGTGEGSGERRAIEAAEAAISNPLLDEVSMRGARGVLINITGGADMTLFEVDEAANRIKEEVDPDANIIVGSTLDESLDGEMRVSVVATGIEVRPSAVARRRGRGAREQAVRAQHAQFPAAPAAGQAGCRGGGSRSRAASAAAGSAVEHAPSPGQPSSAGPAPIAPARPSAWPSPRRPKRGCAKLKERGASRGGLLASAIAPAGALSGMGQAARPGARRRAAAQPVRAGHRDASARSGRARPSRRRLARAEGGDPRSGDRGGGNATTSPPSCAASARDQSPPQRAAVTNCNEM